MICPKCGAQAPEAKPGDRCVEDEAILIVEGARQLCGEDLFLGRRVADRYAVFDLLGRGGFGAVYRAIQEPLGREIALKTVRPDAMGGGIDPKARFFQEAKILAKLTHPGIVRVFDYGEDEGGLYMALEMIPGQPLSERLKAGPLPAHEAAEIGAQILNALIEPHEHGLIHRDLKPDNVLIVEGREGPEIKLIDFGIAKAVLEESDLHTRTGLAIGTVRYMAPEQLRQDGVIGPWTDQYAVGVMLYRMLIGATPFRGSTAEMAAGHLERPPPPFPAGMDLPLSLERIVFKALAKRPEARFEGTEAMRAALLGFIEGNPYTKDESFGRVEPDPPPPPLPEGPSVSLERAPPRGLTPRAWLLAGILLGLIALLYNLDHLERLVAPPPEGIPVVVGPDGGLTLASRADAAPPPKAGLDGGLGIKLGPPLDKGKIGVGIGPPLGATRPGVVLPDGRTLMHPDDLMRLAARNAPDAGAPTPDMGSIYKSLTFGEPAPKLLMGDPKATPIFIEAGGAEGVAERLELTPAPQGSTSRLDALRTPGYTPEPSANGVKLQRILRQGQQKHIERQRGRLERALQQCQCGTARDLLRLLGAEGAHLRAAVEACRYPKLGEERCIKGVIRPL